MNSRERVKKTLNHQQPDKIPIDLGGFTSTIEAEPYEELKNYLELKNIGPTLITTRTHVAPDEVILDKFGVDTRYLRPFPLQRWGDIKKQKYIIDGWGIKWQRLENSHYFDPIFAPLSNYTYEDLKYYTYPDLWVNNFENELSKRAESLYKNTDYYLIADILSLGIFETSWALRGMENFLVDLMINKAFANKLLDIIFEQRKEYFRKFLDIVGPFIDMVMVTDDLATQDSLMMSPELYREMIKPRHYELNTFIKSKYNVKIFHHSCGAIRSLIDDLIDTGVDVLNPIQVTAKGMHTKKLKEDFGEKIVFWGGGCDTQKVLPFGTAEEVRIEVKKRISDLKSGGGFVFSQVHEIQPGTPPENIVKMYESVKEFRDY